MNTANFLTEIGGVDDVLAIQGALLHEYVITNMLFIILNIYILF